MYVVVGKSRGGVWRAPLTRWRLVRPLVPNIDRRQQAWYPRLHQCSPSAVLQYPCCSRCLLCFSFQARSCSLSQSDELNQDPRNRRGKRKAVVAFSSFPLLYPLTPHLSPVRLLANLQEMYPIVGYYTRLLHVTGPPPLYVTTFGHLYEMISLCLEFFQ
jgi:hypothetical protein